MKRKLLSLIICAIMLMQVFDFGINGVNTVYADSNTNTAANTPDFDIQRSFDKSVYTEGDAAKIIYTVKPKGSITSNVKGTSDIILAIDVSYSMDDNDYGWDSSKFATLKSNALKFVDRISSANNTSAVKDKIGIVTFGYKTNYKYSATSDYTSVKNEINKLQLKDLITGTNYDDAIKESMGLLSNSSASNKYIILISDGMPNYFTSTEYINKYKNNRYSYYESGKYYYTKYPGKTTDAYDSAVNDAVVLKSKNIKLFSLGVGSGKNIDICYLTQLSEASGGKAYQSTSIDKLLDQFYKVADCISQTKFSNIVITETIPSGISVTDTNIGAPVNGKINISIPDITYQVNGGTPLQFTVEVSIKMNKSGTYTFNSGSVLYNDFNNAVKQKTINNSTITVNASNNPPDFSISKTADRSAVVQGDTINLNYVVTPTGNVTNSNATVRKPVDIVLVIDKSYSMYDSNKFTNAKTAAKNFVNNFKAQNLGDNISVVSFNKYSTVDIGLTNVSTDSAKILTAIDGIAIEPYYSEHSGTNYEIGFSEAANQLASSTRAKYVVFLSDGMPNWYVYTYNLWGFKYEVMLSDTSVGGMAYTSASDEVKEMAKNGITLYTIGVGSDDDIDAEYMDDLATLGGGSSFNTANAGDLTNIFNSISNEVEQQKISNIVITEQLPSGIEVVGSNGVNVNGNMLTVRVPDIVFQKGAGTPPAVTVTAQLKFNNFGSFKISDVSKVDYISWDGNKASKNLNSINVTVTPSDTVAPTVVKVTSTINNGTYAAGTVIPITVKFSENVNVVGRPQLQLETGDNDQFAYYDSGSGTDTLVFLYTVQPGDYSNDLDYKSINALDLNNDTAKIQDASGNDAVLTLPNPGSANSISGSKDIVVKANSTVISSGAISATNGAAVVSAICDSRMNVKIKFNIGADGKLVMDLVIPTSSQQLFDAMAISGEFKDKYGNVYTVTKLNDGSNTFRIESKTALVAANNPFELVLTFDVGSIDENNYEMYLKTDGGMQKLDVKIVPPPNIT